MRVFTITLRYASQLMGSLVAERNRFSPSARAGHLGFAASGPPPNFRLRGSLRSLPRAA